ncbi:hypothetical protein DSO57_1028769 [Entomophthora muscae]|uniref:Uncharacterized protein n=1 Tax=Entomophthora muscae TaxID=34485 RepID=A0ACC2T1G4_9FUNG|nr:hypothetical protein DSO57_1028769 [Entomophthora muscae]
MKYTPLICCILPIAALFSGESAPKEVSREEIDALIQQVFGSLSNDASHVNSGKDDKHDDNLLIPY